SALSASRMTTSKRNSSTQPPTQRLKPACCRQTNQKVRAASQPSVRIIPAGSPIPVSSAGATGRATARPVTRARRHRRAASASEPGFTELSGSGMAAAEAFSKVAFWRDVGLLLPLLSIIVAGLTKKVTHKGLPIVSIGPGPRLPGPVLKAQRHFGEDAVAQ